MRRFLFSFHRWIGLFAGVFLLFIGLSGSLLVFHRPLDRWLNPTIFDVKPSGGRLSMDSLYTIVYNLHGEEFASCSADIPTGLTERVEFTLTKPQEDYFSRDLYLITMHPYSGAVLREGYCHDVSTSPVHWIMYFHDSFHFGRIGMLIVSSASLAIFLSMITGLLIYGKSIGRVLAFRIPLKGVRSSRFYRSIHVYFGVWSLVFNMVVCLTGFWMMKDVFNPSTWKLDDGHKSVRIVASIDSCLARSRLTVPGFVPDFISIPLVADEPIEIDGDISTSPPLMRGDACSVLFDATTGRAVDATDISHKSFPANLPATVWPLHVGNYGGTPIRCLYALGGLTPGVLSVSAYVLWWKRKKIYRSMQRSAADTIHP